jgi:hypothetical protein
LGDGIVPECRSHRFGAIEERWVPWALFHQRNYIEAIRMRDTMKLRGYAEDCRRLAKSMKPEHKATLLEIADAWDEVAEEAEREGGTNERGKRQ